MSFSGAGLALDLVGAVLLSLGIFGPPRPTQWGWSRWPEDAARDRGFGAAGGVCLIFGFVFQLLGAAGFGASGQAPSVLSALVAVEVGAIVIAYPIFGLTYWASMHSEITRNAEYLKAEGVSYRRRPDGLRFWNYDRTITPPGETAPPG